MRLDLVGDELDQIDSIWGRTRWGRTRHGAKPAATDRCHDAMYYRRYYRIRRENRVHGEELALIPLLFFFVGVRVETAIAFYFKT